ncbi:hypothetical protein HZA99_05850 [Candidatus Woesearchaeota archaeon]|nr:hypothetical protein [Candidatus Woesearchaeota archaeon]
MDEIKYLDTYVLCEIAKANVRFLPLLVNTSVVNDLTLAEFYGVILREFNEQTAEYWKSKFLAYAKPVSLDVLILAVKFRKEHAKRNVSFFDAVGYIFAKENGGIFVTGDKEFQRFPRVEFIKA